MRRTVLVAVIGSYVEFSGQRFRNENSYVKVRTDVTGVASVSSARMRARGKVSMRPPLAPFGAILTELYKRVLVYHDLSTDEVLRTGLHDTKTDPLIRGKQFTSSQSAISETT